MMCCKKVEIMHSTAVEVIGKETGIKMGHQEAGTTQSRDCVYNNDVKKVLISNEEKAETLAIEVIC